MNSGDGEDWKNQSSGYEYISVNVICRVLHCAITHFNVSINHNFDVIDPAVVFKFIKQATE